MRILYGIQGTGNGHITRARTMSRAFAEAENIHVDYLVSGRSAEKLFDMEPFGDFRVLRGMTMDQTNGKVNYIKTAFTNNVFALMSEVFSLDISGYDLVISDFEPVTAWAAKKAKKKVLGISHQYSFKYPIPTAGGNIATHLVMKYFAPTNISLGVHWHHFDHPILPPLIEPLSYPVSHQEDKILVYLPFEEKETVINWLCAHSAADKKFVFYCEAEEVMQKGNVTVCSLSRENFQKDLASCGGVICNAGFGLMSESIQAGKKLLIKPVKGQMEQLSNAVAAKRLQLADVLEDGFDGYAKLNQWLDKPNRPPRPYPDVAKGIVDWIASGMESSEQALSQSLWSAY